MKKAQKITIWLLPLIVIGGLFYPILGYLVLAMMAVLLVMSIFKGRHWCWNLCPRGAFLDIVMPRASLNKPVPKLFARQWFRWSVFFAFMIFLVFRLSRSGGSFAAVGAVFVGMCIITTVISVILGAATKHRAWCAICPMGTLQEKAGKVRSAGSK
ncbi:MAG: 4Fe-4S binding protein [Candidatus Omnitrophica bacterium]|nr:4Fe-4S binding protein [Candidatus Omnitrophota bacterium]MDD5552340.1 4Fe-4S binding protein [Candidatus Omnitrophota bacterium]